MFSINCDAAGFVRRAYCLAPTFAVALVAGSCNPLSVFDSDDLEKIEVLPTIGYVLTGGSVQFQAEAVHESGKHVIIAPTWTVVNGGGTINNAGLFTASATPGSYSQTVKASKGGMTAAASVVISAPEPPRPPSGGNNPPNPPPGTGFSCPTVYSWDGSHWRLDSGTFGGAISEGLARTDVDNLEHAVAINDIVTLNVRNDLDETDHIDALSLLVVDHKPGVIIAPTSDGRIFGLRRPATPIRATDNRGQDILARVTQRDGVSWESVLDIRNVSDSSAVTDPIEITFRRPLRLGDAKLLITAQNTEWGNSMLRTFLSSHGAGLEAWYDRVNNDAAFARASRAALARAGFLHVSLWTRDGWQQQGTVWEVGPELMKQQVVPLDLRHAAPGSIRIRLEAPPSFWRIDQVALATRESESFTATVVMANDSLVRNIDGRMKTVTTGNGFQLSFKVPPQQPGNRRTYMVSSTGWYHINVPVTNQPNLEFLQRIAAGPRSMQRLSVELRNQLILRAQQGS